MKHLSSPSPRWDYKLTWHSFSARLCFYIILIASVLFISVLAIFTLFSGKIVKQEAMRHAESELSNTVLQIEDILHQVEVATANMDWAIEERRTDPDSLYRLTRKMLQNNPFVIGSCIAFEPSYYPEKGTLFAPYSYLDGDTIRNKQLGTADYNYLYMDWYQIPKLLEQDYWSEPYYDEGGLNDIISTYSHLLRDSNGKMYGILTADISLHHLTELVSQIHPFPSSYNFMIGRGGAYLVHPKPERILSETVFTATTDMKDSTVNTIGRAMLRGEKGMYELQNDDTLSYVFYEPVRETGWSVAVVCPHKEVFDSLDNMQRLIILVFIAGLLIMLPVCIWVIRRVSKPLKLFSDAVVRIAKGDLNAPLPDIKTKDEMAHLRDSFEYMQQSLSEYIDRLTETTASKERIESELRIARNIQMGMIPKIFPPFPDRKNLDIYACLIPAKEVGGDLYDFFIRDEKLFFTIGDVSGKGIPASLFMAITRSLFRIMAGQYDSPLQITVALNHAIAESNEENMFVTMFIGVFDLISGRLVFCNAAHNPPVLVQEQDECTFLPVQPNIPIGVLECFAFQEQEVYLSKHTALLLYTDGLTEAENIRHEQFGNECLLREVTKYRQSPVQKIVTQLQKEVTLFAGEARQSDDLTLLCIRNNER